MGRICISLLTECVLTPHGLDVQHSFMKSFLLKLSLQITSQNEIRGDGGDATFIYRKFGCHCEFSNEPSDYFEAQNFLSSCNIDIT